MYSGKGRVSSVFEKLSKIWKEMCVAKTKTVQYIVFCHFSYMEQNVGCPTKFQDKCRTPSRNGMAKIARHLLY